VSVGRELARLVIHGTLHLAGHDHHRSGERERMRRAEARAMRAARDSIVALDAAWRRARGG
jgi:rRNA maturation RNase YbeY